MGIYDTAIRRRSIRHYQDRPVPRDLLQRCVDAARLAPTGANLQPLEFVVIDDPQLLPRVFSTIGWAMYVKPAHDPPSGKEAKAYILILKRRDVDPAWVLCDVGAAMQSILLVALEQGLGSCPLLSVDFDSVRRILNIPDEYETSLLIALGYPDESPVQAPYEGSVKYWKDDRGALHVPKKGLGSVLHWNAFA
ncbi:MAG: nitroreductase family protein [Chloroflexota bacterium]